MNERGKSDRPVVPEKPSNNAALAAAEVVEERGLPEGNAGGEPRPGRRAGDGASSDLDRVRLRARKDREVRFTALLHHITIDRLRDSYRALRRRRLPELTA